MAVRGDIRNVAIVAHVDHGKTTLVNAMLAQSHVFNEREEVPDRVMDSNDLEREKGITILAKNTAVQYTGPLAAKYGHPEGITLNIIDTPGHADFGGEVERGISMVDGVVLLVDASEGPLPQTRFVLRKALEAKLPVILCVNKTERPDAWEVQGRGELALAVLAEQMRREGFELTGGRPQVVTKTIDGVVNEPMENTTIDVPEEYMGAVTQLLADRKGRMDNMTNHGTGWVRLQFTVPSRGLIGFRTALLSATRGTGIASSISAGYAPWAGQIVTRQNGSMVCDRQGIATPYAMQRLQARGNFFVEPQSPVYEGQVVGINNKPDELDVNITLAKHMTNMRSATADVLETLTPPIKMSLEESLDFANEDECVEVTPESIRVRKIILSREDWYKWRAKQRRQNNAQNNK